MSAAGHDWRLPAAWRFAGSSPLPPISIRSQGGRGIPTRDIRGRGEVSMGGSEVQILYRPRQTDTPGGTRGPKREPAPDTNEPRTRGGERARQDRRRGRSEGRPSLREPLEERSATMAGPRCYQWAPLQPGNSVRTPGPVRFWAGLTASSSVISGGSRPNWVGPRIRRLARALFGSADTR